MEIFSYYFVNAHIIGCSPVKKITVTDGPPSVAPKYFYQVDVYTSGGMHQFKSDIFNWFNDGNCTQDQLDNHNTKINIWKEHADQRINLIESLNPSNYDQPA